MMRITGIKPVTLYNRHLKTNPANRKALMLNDHDVPTPASSGSFTWSDERLLGFARMDDIHVEFYDVVRELLFSDEASVVKALERFEQHAIEHFGEEDTWMQSTGFPPRDCHMEEHAAVLQSAREVKALVSEGNAGADMAHSFALHLFEWFPGHAAHLDSALAAWMCKQKHGGKPVVLRRRPLAG
jgi:hemerythrin-like metal-binding protein